MNYFLSDSLALAGRQLKQLKRVPTKLISVTVVPIVTVLIFGYLFGSMINTPGLNYRSFIMAGIFMQVMLSGVSSTAIGVAADLKTGIVDRFRSMPIARPAVLVGRTLADILLSALACTIMALVGLLIGWRTTTDPVKIISGFAILLLAGYVLAWLGALIGLALRSPEAVTSVTFLISMPLTFLSNAFVNPSVLPSGLQIVAEWNPVSAVIGAMRELWGNTAPGTVSTAFPAQYPVVVAVVSLLVLMVILVPTSTRAYRAATAR
ncbi:ABC transporter permease [Streptomyces sp. NPDC048483]|uniref:ABC transporter permease n=1 Tax=Streptomyces sp. NPDC048483 TaxID=3154927 RepID=UPI003438BF1E